MSVKLRSQTTVDPVVVFGHDFYPITQADLDTFDAAPGSLICDVDERLTLIAEPAQRPGYWNVIECHSDGTERTWSVTS